MPQVKRWEALDLLRGLSIIGMLLNLVPGAWDQQYDWLEHAKWQGWHWIDLVAPIFLFCVGGALPFAVQSRIDKGDSTVDIAKHILWRALAIILIGLFLNAYPGFDFAHMRIPGVLQRIGLCFGLCGLFLVFAGRPNGGFSVPVVAGAIAFILLSYFVLLQFVPVPGFGAQHYDPVGNWPAYVDRAVITIPHMFLWFPVDGKVVFDPEGIISTWPACATLLLGTLTALMYRSGSVQRPALTTALSGAAMIALAYAFNGVCPIIKNIWTPTFVLFSGGASLVALGGLMAAVAQWDIGRFLFPVKVFGTNPLLAYLICFILSPLIYLDWINSAWGVINVPAYTQMLATGMMDLKLASFLFSVGFLAFEFAILWVCYRRRWFLRL